MKYILYERCMKQKMCYQYPVLKMEQTQLFEI